MNAIQLRTLWQRAGLPDTMALLAKYDKAASDAALATAIASGA